MAGDVFGAEGVSVGLVAGLPVEELARKLAVALRAGEACQRALAFYLRELDVRRLYLALGYASAVQFAVNRLRLSKGRARDLLRAGRQLEALPELDAAFARGELSWSKVRRIVRVAAPDNQAKWIERCRDLTAEQVEGLTASVGEGDDPPSLERGLPQPKFALRFLVGALEHEMFEQARAKLGAELGRTVTDDQLLGELVRLFLSSDADGSVPGRKAVDGSLFRVVVQGAGLAASAGALTPTGSTGAPGSGRPGSPPASTAALSRDPASPLPKATATGITGGADAAALAEHEAVHVDAEQFESLRVDAELPPRIRRRILRRDGHRCRHCGAQRCPMVHHIEWRSWGGRHDDPNLVTLCGNCHGLVHARLLKVTRGRDGLVFVDSLGRSLRTALPATEVVVAGAGALLGKGIPAGTDAAALAAVQVASDTNGTVKGAGDERPTARAGARPALGTDVPEYLEPHQVPEMVDVEWWRRHAHCFEWTRDGRGVRLRQQLRRSGV